jgi:hypothetical protein
MSGWTGRWHVYQLLTYPRPRYNNLQSNRCMYGEVYHQLKLNGLADTLIDFHELANHILGPQTNFTFSPRPSNSLLAILKNISDLEHWTNRNQEFRQ